MEVFFMKLRYFMMLLVLALLFLVLGCAAKSQLISASSSGNVETIKKLLAEGANINERDSNGWTALMYAAWKNNIDAAKYLIESGADVNAKDIHNDKDALLIATNYSLLEMMKLLTDKGANIESTDYQGDTPLVYAALYAANIDATKLLIKKGANINTKNNNSEDILSRVINEKIIKSSQDYYKESIAYGIIINELLKARGSILYKAPHDKARIIFFAGENDFAPHLAINLRYIHRTQRFNYLDVNPGSCEIYATKLTGAKIAKQLGWALVQPYFVDTAWYFVDFNPGEDNNEPLISLKVQAGETYYVKISSRSEWHLVNELSGKDHIKSMLSEIEKSAKTK
jgi:hypothetical protein